MRLSSLAIFLAFSSLFYQTALANRNNYTKTQYPILLVHGMFGWDQLLGVGDYFYKIPLALSQSGTEVFVARLNPLTSAELAGEQLLEQVEIILAAFGYKKIHLFGHSQGAQSSRYVAAVRPDLVASVTSFTGAARGSKVADLILKIAPDGSLRSELMQILGNGVAQLISLFSKTAPPAMPDVLISLKSLSTAGTREFNRRYPMGLPKTACGSYKKAQQANGVLYYSIAGTQQFTHFLDTADYILRTIHLIAFKNEKSDGLIGQCASHLGEVIRDDYKINHVDAMNHLYGLSSLDPVPIYRQAVNRLKVQGL